MKLIDTSLWLEYFRIGAEKKYRDQVIALLSTNEACWCDMVRLELQRVSRKNPKGSMDLLESTLPLLETTRAVWEQANRIATKARARGKPIPNTDILIFATARVHGVELAHRDQHFETLARLA